MVDFFGGFGAGIVFTFAAITGVGWSVVKLRKYKRKRRREAR